jgi:hypothetical protein
MTVKREMCVSELSRTLMRKKRKGSETVLRIFCPPFVEVRCVHLILQGRKGITVRALCRNPG